MRLDYDEMVELCESKKEFSRKIEQIGDNEVEIFTYHVSMTDTFDSELAKWFRGTVFDADTKACICRPFPKFFNLNEHDESKEHAVDWDSALYYHKMDGSLVMPVLLSDGDIRWKSKSTFHSAHALKAQHMYQQMDENAKLAIIGFLKMGHTPLFELISPDPEFRIVIEYPDERLVFLGAVDIESGRIIPGPTAVSVDRHEIAKMEGIEGFVIYDGQKLVKMKTAWYLERHRAVYGMSFKSIVEATLSGSIDDVIGVVAGLGMEYQLEVIERIRDTTVEELLAVTEYAHEVYAEVKAALPEGYTRKELAMKLKTDIHPQYHKFFFALEDGRDIEEMVKKFVFEIMMDK